MKTLLLISLLIGLSCSGQGQTINFERAYNYNYYSSGTCILQLANEGYLIGGSIFDTIGASNSKMFLMRTDKFGDTIWTKHYDFAIFQGAPIFQSIKKLYIQPNNEILLFGTVNSLLAGSNESWLQLIRTDSLGNLIWSKKYFKHALNYLFDIFSASDNSFLLSLASEPTMFSGVAKSIVTEIDASGNILWNTFFINDSISATGIAEINNAYYLVCENYSYNNWNNLDLVKISANGSLISSITWNMAGKPIRSKIINTDNDDLVVVCQYSDTTDGYLLLLKSDTLGNIVWTKTFLGWQISSPKVIETYDAGYAIVSDKPCASPYNISLIKTNIVGDTSWTKIYGVPANENHPGEIIETLDSGFAITGNYGPPLYLIKANVNGTSGCEFFCPNIIVGNIPIAQVFSSYLTYNDSISCTPISGVTSTGITDNIICSSVSIKNNVITNYGFSVYPNPASTTLMIAPNEASVLTIANLLGQVVFEKHISARQFEEIRVDVSYLSSGMYLVRMGKEIRLFIKE